MRRQLALHCDIYKRQTCKTYFYPKVKKKRLEDFEASRHAVSPDTTNQTLASGSGYYQQRGGSSQLKSDQSGGTLSAGHSQSGGSRGGSASGLHKQGGSFGEGGGSGGGKPPPQSTGKLDASAGKIFEKETRLI